MYSILFTQLFFCLFIYLYICTGSSYDGMNIVEGQILTAADNEKITSLERYAEFCESASDVFLKMALKNTKIPGKSYHDIVEDLTTQMIYGLGDDERGFLQQSDDMRASAGAVWLQAGIAHLEIATGMESHEMFMNSNVCENGMNCQDIINKKDKKNINVERNFVIKIKNNENDNNERKSIQLHQEMIFRRYETAVKCFQSALKYGIFATNALTDDDVLTLFSDKIQKSNSLITQPKIQIQAKKEGEKEEDTDVRLLEANREMFLDFITSSSNPSDTTSSTTVPTKNILLSPVKGMPNPFSAPLGAPCRVLLW